MRTQWKGLLGSHHIISAAGGRNYIITRRPPKLEIEFGHRLFFDEKGTAAIEFGMVAMILCGLLLGIIDFGMGYWEKIQVGNAARAGGEYAMANGWNQSAITTAVTSATGLSSITATPAPTETYGCPSATGGITTASNGASCTGGGTAGTYVTVNAQATYSPIFPFASFANAVTLTATTIVRIN
jgi:Flp pilus assembly protein TadG